MRVFIKEKSNHSNQKRLDQQPTSKVIVMAIALATISISCLAIALYFVPTSLYSIILLAHGEEIVNVNFLALAGVAGFFLLPVALFASYVALRYRRVIIPEELTPPFRRYVMLSFKATFFSLFAVSPICIALSFTLIYLHDYSWCPQMSLGSGWDSWWVIDPQLCKSPN